MPQIGGRGLVLVLESLPDVRWDSLLWKVTSTIRELRTSVRTNLQGQTHVLSAASLLTLPQGRRIAMRKRLREISYSSHLREI